MDASVAAKLAKILRLAVGGPSGALLGGNVARCIAMGYRAVGEIWPFDWALNALPTRLCLRL